MADSPSVSPQVISRSGKNRIDPREFWKKKFHEAKDDKDADEEEKTDKEQGEERERKRPPVPVPGLGDEAYWVDTGRDGALYVLSGDRIVRLSVGGAAAQDAKRATATRLARTALKALPSS
jgi:hypothetical protein